MEVVHLDEDRIFSLNISGKFTSTKEDRQNELLMEITDDWLEKQIQTIIKHQNIVNIDYIRSWNYSFLRSLFIFKKQQ